MIQLGLPGDPYAPLQKMAVSLNLNEWVRFQFACVGQVSTAAIPGHALGPAISKDATEPGAVRVHTHGGSFRHLEVMLLDGLPEAEAIKLADEAAGTLVQKP
jgi:hypothetical protein